MAHVEYQGVRMNLDHLGDHPRREIERVCQAYIDGGMRPLLLTVHDEGVDVTERPDLWPPRVRDYRGARPPRMGRRTARLIQRRATVTALGF